MNAHERRKAKKEAHLVHAGREALKRQSTEEALRAENAELQRSANDARATIDSLRNALHANEAALLNARLRVASLESEVESQRLTILAASKEIDELNLLRAHAESYDVKRLRQRLQRTKEELAAAHEQLRQRAPARKAPHEMADFERAAKAAEILGKAVGAGS